jgi:integrase
MSAALQIAVRNGLVQKNVAAGAILPRAPGSPTDRPLPVWTAEEARQILVAADAVSPQTSCFFATALDSGARRGELQGLPWTEVDLVRGTMRIGRQFLGFIDGQPTFGETKTRRIRTVDLSAETVKRLREHKRVQAELKLANRDHYVDHGLVFARTYEHTIGTVPLGFPLGAAVIRRTMDLLTEAAGVHRITVHGLRHTSATLLLAAGVQPHVVQRRLGHSSINVTLNLYAHVLPSMQQDAACRLGEMLYGRNA